MKDVAIYQTPSELEPFTKRLEFLREGLGRSAILKWVTRARLGNLGDHKSVGQGVIEMRVKVGPGYRTILGCPGTN